MADPVELRNALLAKLSAAGFDTSALTQDYWYAIAKALVGYTGGNITLATSLPLADIDGGNAGATTGTQAVAKDHRHALNISPTNLPKENGIASVGSAKTYADVFHTHPTYSYLYPTYKPPVRLVDLVSGAVDHGFAIERSSAQIPLTITAADIVRLATEAGNNTNTGTFDLSSLCSLTGYVGAQLYGDITYTRVSFTDKYGLLNGSTSTMLITGTIGGVNNYILHPLYHFGDSFPGNYFYNPEPYIIAGDKIYGTFTVFGTSGEGYNLLSVSELPLAVDDTTETSVTITSESDFTPVFTTLNRVSNGTITLSGQVEFSTLVRVTTDDPGATTTITATLTVLPDDWVSPTLPTPFLTARSGAIHNTTNAVKTFIGNIATPVTLNINDKLILRYKATTNSSSAQTVHLVYNEPERQTWVKLPNTLSSGLDLDHNHLFNRGAAASHIAAAIAPDVSSFTKNLSVLDTTVQKALSTIDKFNIVTTHNDLLHRDATACHPASSIAPDVTGFNKNLSSADDTVQKALDTIDNLNIVTVHNNLTGRDTPSCHPADAITVVTSSFNKRLSASDSVVQTALETLDQADDVGEQLGSFRITDGVTPPYGYDLALVATQDDKASYKSTPGEKSTIINNTTGFVELATVCSPIEGTGILRWPAGHWRVNFLAKLTELVPAPNNTSYIRVSVAKRTSSAELDIGWTNYDVPVLGTTFANYSCYRILNELNVSVTDCILIRFYAWTNSTNLVEITLGYDDANGYSRIETPVAVPPVGRVLPAAGNQPSFSLYDAIDVTSGISKSLTGSTPDQKVQLAVQATPGTIYHARQTITSYAIGYNHGTNGTWFDVCTATGFNITSPCDIVAKANLSGKCTQTNATCSAQIVIDYGSGFVNMAGGTAAFKTSSIDGSFTLALTGLASLVIPNTYNCTVKLQITTDNLAEFYISPGGTNNYDAASLVVTEYATDSYGTIVRLGGAITGGLNINLGGPGLNDSTVPKTGRAIRVDSSQYANNAVFSLNVVGYVYSQLGTSVGVVNLVETTTRTSVATLYVNGTSPAAFSATATISATPKIYELQYSLYTSPTPQPGDVVFLNSADLMVNAA